MEYLILFSVALRRELGRDEESVADSSLRRMHTLLQSVAAVQLMKPTSVWCQRVCTQGCGIYDTRPVECQAFRCIWLNGYFSEDDGPDRLGVVFFEELTPDEQTIVTVSESNPGAASSPRVRELIRLILEMGIEVVVRNNKSVAKACPDGRIVKFRVDQEDPLKVRTVSEFSRTSNQGRDKSPRTIEDR